MIDEKPHRRWWTSGSGGERSNERKQSILLQCTILNMGDTMVLVPSSRGEIYRSKVVTKSVHENDEKRQFITVKYVNDPQSWLTMT